MNTDGESFTWWRHQMETFFALLAICAGNSPVPGEFPAQRPVTRSFDVFFDLRLNKRLSKQSWGWWFETPLRPLWRHRNELCMGLTFLKPHVEKKFSIIDNQCLPFWLGRGMASQQACKQHVRPQGQAPHTWQVVAHDWAGPSSPETTRSPSETDTKLKVFPTLNFSLRPNDAFILSKVGHHLFRQWFVACSAPA